MRRLLFATILAGITHPAAAQGYWYYCDPAHEYYPYVSSCPVPWRQLVPYRYGQKEPQAASTPTVESSPPKQANPIPAIVSEPESRPSPDYRQGQMDRQSWETWFGSLTGDYRAGAEYWAGQRSLSNPGSCDIRPPSTGPNWMAGCIAAQQRLAASDVRRKAQPDYRLGWNNPSTLASPQTDDSGTPATQTLVHEPSDGDSAAGLEGTMPRPAPKSTAIQDYSGNSAQPSPTASPPAESDASSPPNVNQAPAGTGSSGTSWIVWIAMAVVGIFVWRIRKAYRPNRKQGAGHRISATQTGTANPTLSGAKPAHLTLGGWPETPVASVLPGHQEPEMSSADDLAVSSPLRPPGHEKRASVPSSIQSCRVVIRGGAENAGRQLRSVRPRRREDARWIPPGGSVVVNGFDISGMVYVGSFMSASPGEGWGAEEPAPCLINPALKVGIGKPRTDLDMDYWPSYSGIEPTHRLNYLHWLSEGKRDTGFPVGYAFLYFYGLERRLLADNPSPQEEALLVAELERLRNLYAASRSFTGYSTALLDVVQLRRLTASPPGLDGWKPTLAEQSETMPIPLRLKIGVMAAMGTPLDFEHAMAAMLTMPHYQGGIRRGIGLTRTRTEFLDLARRRFAVQFPEGFALRDRKNSSLALPYRAASRHFEVNIRVEGISRIPDPLNLTWTKMVELCSRTADDLTPYAKAVGKERVHANSMAATLALPEDYGDTVATTAFKRWLAGLPVPFAEVPLAALGQWCFGERKAADGMKQAREMSAILAWVGYGMEPDPAYGAPKPTDAVLLFPVATRAVPASAAFQRAGVIAAVLASGGTTADRGPRIASELARRLTLGADETIRVTARYRVMLGRVLPVSGLTKLAQSMTVEERTAVAAMSVAVAAATCGEMERAMITALERLHDAFGVERRSLYAVLHQVAANSTARAVEPVIVEQPLRPSDRFRIPSPPPAPAPAAELSIDMARVSAILRQTREVAEVLAPIYEDDPPSPEQPAVEMPSISPGFRFHALGADYARLLEALCGRERWSRADYEAVARSFDLLPDGAIEAINEWAFDEVGEELIEDGDPLTINMALLPKASEEAA